MNVSFSVSIFFVIILDGTIAKSGGRGGGGGGRGHSGARSSFSRSGGSGGGKFHSSTSHSTYINYDSSSFRSSVFGKSSKMYFNQGTTSNTYIISQPSTPIIYDNHNYYWRGHYRSQSVKKTVCEYAISDEDGELMNVTFANGTSPKALVFECGDWEKCCGMTCCSSIGDWLGFSLWMLVFVIAISYGCCKSGKQ